MSFFFSPIAYVVLIGVLLVNGISCMILIQFMNEQPTDVSVFTIFFNSFFSWLALIVMIPLITMKLFAEEKKVGTYESLMTTPLKNGEYVIAKFLAGYAFYLLLWAPTVVYFILVGMFAATPLDHAPVYGGFIGLILIGLLAIAMGCFGSCMTSNQIVAAVITFALFGGLLLIGFLPYAVAGKSREVFQSFSMIYHMEELVQGLLDWRRVIFYLSGSLFFLFLTYKIVEARQWKA
jgi:gliding motility-associated transport system permease protein